MKASAVLSSVLLSSAVAAAPHPQALNARALEIKTEIKYTTITKYVTVDFPSPMPEPSPNGFYELPPNDGATTTQAAPASPTTTTIQAPVVPPTKAYQPPAEPASTSKATPPGGAPNQYEGEMTCFPDIPNGWIGFCDGLAYSKEDAGIALSKDFITKSMCGKTIEYTYNGQTAKAKVVEKCMGCKPQDIDLTPGAWKLVTGDAYSRYLATWRFVD